MFRVITRVVLLAICIPALANDTSLTLTRIVTTQIVGKSLRSLKKIDEFKHYCFSVQGSPADNAWGKLSVYVSRAKYGPELKYRLYVQNADAPPSPLPTAPYACPDQGAMNWTADAVISALDQTMTAVEATGDKTEILELAFPVCFAGDLWDRIKPVMRRRMHGLHGNAKSLYRPLTNSLLDAVGRDSITSQVKLMVARHGYEADGVPTVFWDCVLLQDGCPGRPWAELAERDDLGLEPIVICYALRKRP